MEGVTAKRFATLDCFGSHGPPMTIGRCQDRGFKIDSQIVPKSVWLVQCVFRLVTDEILKSAWFRRIQEAKDAALVLTEAPPRYRTEQACDNWMKWPASFQRVREILRRSRALTL